MELEDWYWPQDQGDEDKGGDIRDEEHLVKTGMCLHPISDEFWDMPISQEVCGVSK